MTWTQIGKDIDGTAINMRSGSNVSISGDGQTVSVISPFSDGSGGYASNGLVTTYTINDDGTWSKQGSILGETDQFIRSASLSNDGSRLAVGRILGADGSGTLTGDVRVYEKLSDSSGNVVWTQLGTTIYGEAYNDIFGQAVRLSGDGQSLLVGAPQSDTGGEDGGEVYFYKYLDGAWTIDYSVYAGEGSELGYDYSFDISDDGTVAVVGDAEADLGVDGTGFIIQYRETDDVWERGFTGIGDSPYDYYGYAVQVSGDGNTMVVSATGQDTSTLNGPGSVIVLRHWSQIPGQDVPGWYQINQEIFGENFFDAIGVSVDISNDGSVIAIGSSAFKGEENQGQVSIYKDFGDGRWTQIGSSMNGENLGDQAGTVSLSNDGSTVVIGALFADSIYENSGHTRIFKFQNSQGKTISLTNINSIEGTTTNNSLVSTNSNEFINGYAGTDTVVLTGLFKDYSISRQDGLLTMDDSRTSDGNGYDWLRNIEYIQFTDQTVEESKVDVVKTYSGEFSDYKFYNRGNGVYEIKTDSGYDNITGYPLLTFTGEETTSSFREISAIVDIKGTFDLVTGLNTDSGRMFRLYNASFKRLPDPVGLEYWINQFSSGANSIRVVASSFLGSAEFAERYGSDVNDVEFVNTLYKNVLGRDADTDGLNYWLGQLMSGAETRYEALLGFAESAENKALFTEMTGIA